MPLITRSELPNITKDVEIEKPMEVRLLEFLVKIQGHAIQLRMNHWQTESFSEHKTTDGFIDVILKNADRIAEVMLGEFGRPHINTMHVNVSDIGITSTKWVLDELNAGLQEMISEVRIKDHEGILVTLGDFDAELKKAIYLSTLG